MRSFLSHLSLAAALAIGLAVGLTADPAPAAAETATARTFIEFGSEVKYRVALAPLAPVQLGRTAAAMADGGALPPITGDVRLALDPRWLQAGIGDGASRGKMPLASRVRSGKCRCATELGDDKKTRVAALYVERGFDIEDADAVEMLEFRARYRDGLVVAINGREVVRRSLSLPREPMAPAARPRGPESESFFVPVTAGLLKDGANVLRIEVRPSGHRTSPTLDFELVARRGPRITRGPIVSRDATGVTVVFDTDLPATGHVAWGTSAVLSNTAASAGGAMAVRHRVRVGIKPSDVFHYQVRAGGDASRAFVVKPQPQVGDVVRFSVYGDMRGGHGVHARIVKAIAKEAPDFVLVTGDLVLRGSDAGDWQKFFDVAGDLLASIPYLPVAGNHDVGRNGEERRFMSELFPLPPAPAKRPRWASWYSIDIAGVHLVMLDSNAYRAAEQLAWLKRDLKDARARGVRAIFAATHDGPYSRGIHRGDRYAARVYAPVLAEHKVAMLFSGHDHLYQRGVVRGLNYIVSGGGGAPLYPIRCGIRGKRRCRVDDGMIKGQSVHHYVTVQVFANRARVCAKLPSRQALEPCVSIKLSK